MTAAVPPPDRLVRAELVHTVGPQGTVRDGAVAVAGGVVAAVGDWEELRSACPQVPVDDLGAVHLLPGLIDAHTHNVEFGPGTTGTPPAGSHESEALRLLDAALRAGITALGEHHLGLATGYGLTDYRAWADRTGQLVRFAAGTCVLGTEPMLLLCGCSRCAEPDTTHLVRADTLADLAGRSEFPGENLFVTASVGNLRVEQARHAGARVWTDDELRRAVDAYHDAGQRIGAHVEGTDAALAFVRAGGDVLHHAHGLQPGAYAEIRASGALVCATPAGGTASPPNTAQDVVELVAAGIEVAVATDAVLPCHPESEVPLADERPVESADLWRVASPAMSALLAAGASVNDALTLVTRNAARVMGVEAVAGTIEVGKRADLVAVAELPFATLHPVVRVEPEVRAVYLQGVPVTLDAPRP